MCVALFARSQIQYQLHMLIFSLLYSEHLDPASYTSIDAPGRTSFRASEASPHFRFRRTRLLFFLTSSDSVMFVEKPRCPRSLRVLS